MDKVEIRFVDKSGTLNMPMPAGSLFPSVGHLVQLRTGPAASALPDGSAIGRSLETWKVVNVTWDDWLASVTIEVRRVK